MYLHLGQNVEVKIKDVIGIFDIDTSTIGKTTKEYLFEAEKQNEVETVSKEMPKTFVVCKEYGKKKVFISSISTATLQKRKEMRSSV